MSIFCMNREKALKIEDLEGILPLIFLDFLLIMLQIVMKIESGTIAIIL